MGRSIINRTVPGARQRKPGVSHSARSLGRGVRTPPRKGPIKTINLISRDNGVGLSTDMALLEQVLTPAGYDVRRVNYQNRSMRLCDLAIFLELFNPALPKYAHHTIGVFNLEWFVAGWEPYLHRFDQLWAKSREAVQVYQRLGLESRYTGFASRDLNDPAVSAERLGCLHLRGHSGLKNTEAVMETWRRNPGLPPLTVVSDTPMRAPKGVTVLPRQGLSALTRLFNENQIHLCPSRAEGWGHYITEAMSTGAVVVTTDASPMNEHVQPGRGWLVPSIGTQKRWRVVEHEVNPDDIAAAVRTVVNLPERERAEVGQRARAFVLDRTEQFAATVLDSIREL